MLKTIGFLGALALVPLSALAADHAHQHDTPYAGEQNRGIKTLSAQDVDDLTNGRGWGLAKAAELNGVPGPAHLLELSGDIPLTPEQVDQISALFDEMQANAIPLGERLVTLERQLNQAFATGKADEQQLKAMLDRIATTRSALRFVHLSAHLRTPEILTPAQIARYNQLRGYVENDDPCANPPPGHDPALWRRHNNCE
ncbi:MAG: Spy/CpxP family protein refolding chaperone [Magnetospiraceae bacterium]